MLVSEIELKSGVECDFRDGRSGVRRLVLSDGLVHLLVEGPECLLSLVVETSQSQTDRHLPVLEDRERLGDVLQTTGGDDLVDRTLLVRLPSDLRPPSQVVGEVGIDGAKLLHLLDHDLRLGCTGGVVLLHRPVEAIEEGFVEDIGADEPTIRVTLSLGVRGGDHGEAGSRLNPLADLLDEHTLALQHRLETHDLGGGEVDLVEEKDRTPTHRLDHGTVAEGGVAIDEAEATEEVVLVRLLSDVHSEALTLALGTRLLDHGGLAVPGQTSHEDRGKHAAVDDLHDRTVVSPRHIVAHAIGDQSGTLASGLSECHAGRGNAAHGGFLLLGGFGAGTVNGAEVGVGSRLDEITVLADLVLTTLQSLATLTLGDPRRGVLHPDAVGDIDEDAAVVLVVVLDHDTSVVHGVKEVDLLAGEVGQAHC